MGVPICAVKENIYSANCRNVDTTTEETELAVIQNQSNLVVVEMMKLNLQVQTVNAEGTESEIHENLNAN